VAEDEPVVQQSAWVICMDVDEFLNVKVGRGTLPDLYAAVGEANMISCTWRLFGNSDVHHFTEGFTLLSYHMCAEEFSPKPHQAWGFKTLFRNEGIFRKLGVHRPKGLRPHLWEKINWVNGSGRRLHTGEYRNAWRSTARTYGYDLVTLNHYAVRNAESFLVKRDRGRVNHVDRDQGLTYWFRMNNNATSDRSIQRHVPKMKMEFDRLMADADIARMHRSCVAAHRDKIGELKAKGENLEFFEQLTSERMAKLSRMHRHFGAKVFIEGPDAVPDDIITDEVGEEFFFTVEETKAS
jgi:predicted ester cyclase